LFEQHTVHFHGYPNASAFYDGVPDASIAINVGGKLYVLLPGTRCGHLFLALSHCSARAFANGHGGSALRAAAAEQGRARGFAVHGAEPVGSNTRSGQQSQPASDWATYEPVRKRCGGNSDILCTTPLPTNQSATRPVGSDTAHPNGGAQYSYAYNDGDGSTYYDVEYPIQIHGFDPNFHFVGMTFNPESFNDMKDKYFLLNGRSYPDTVGGHVCVMNDPLPAWQYRGRDRRRLSCRVR